MATTTPIIFKGIKIGTTEYDKHLTESGEITEEPVEDTVDDGQTLPAKYNVSFSVTVYDDDVMTDANIYKDATDEPVKTTVTFQGVAGALEAEMPDMIVSVRRDFSQNRLGYVLKGTRTGVSLTDLVSTSIAT